MKSEIPSARVCTSATDTDSLRLRDKGLLPPTHAHREPDSEATGLLQTSEISLLLEFFQLLESWDRQVNDSEPELQSAQT